MDALRAPFRRSIGILLLLLAPACLAAAPIAVRHPEGTLHGFLVLRSADGKDLAQGDLINQVQGDRVTAQLVFHFKDGSVDDDISVFSENGGFRLLTDHHLQKGPFFAHPVDLMVDAVKGQVTVRSWDKNGKESVHSQHIDLPADLCTAAMLTPLAKNMPPGGGQVSMLVATPRPMLVKLDYAPEGQDIFRVAGFERKARRIDVKFHLQGLPGVIAPVIGKQPPDLHIWIEEGAVPAFVKEEGLLQEDGAAVTIQSAGPTGPAYNAP